jgi:hypothetical protein
MTDMFICRSFSEIKILNVQPMTGHLPEFIVLQQFTVPSLSTAAAYWSEVKARLISIKLLAAVKEPDAIEMAAFHHYPSSITAMSLTPRIRLIN